MKAEHLLDKWTAKEPVCKIICPTAVAPQLGATCMTIAFPVIPRVLYLPLEMDVMGNEQLG